MTSTTKKILIAVAFGAVVAGGAGVAAASGGGAGDDTDRAIGGDALGKASEAALAHTGEGRVTGTEVGDEESFYEVEVTLDDGSQVDVQLDESFAVVDTMTDVEEPGGEGSGESGGK